MFFRSGSIILVTSILEKLVLMLAYVLIARSSTVEEIGLLALVVLIVEGFVFLGNFGVNERLISKKSLLSPTISLYKGLNDVFCVGVFVTSSFILPLLFLVTEKYDLLLLYLPVSIVPALAVLSRFVVGWMSYHSMYSQQATRKLYAGLAGSVSAIIATVIGLGIYAIVLSKIIYAVVDLLLVYKFFPKAIESTVNFKFMRKFFSFSMKVTVSQALNYGNGKIYELFFVSYFGVVALGLVDVAKRITATLTRTILTPLTNIINSKVVRANDSSKQYTMIVTFICSILSPCFIFLFYISDYLVVTLFTERYAESIDLMRIFCLVSILQLLLWFSSSLIIKTGKPHLLISNQFINTVSMIMTVIIAVSLGLTDLYSFMVIALYMILLSTLLRFLFLASTTDLKLADTLVILLVATFIATTTYCVLKAVFMFISVDSLFTTIILFVVTGIMILSFVSTWFYFYRNMIKDV